MNRPTRPPPYMGPTRHEGDVSGPLVMNGNEVRAQPLPGAEVYLGAVKSAQDDSGKWSWWCYGCGAATISYLDTRQLAAQRLREHWQWNQ